MSSLESVKVDISVVIELDSRQDDPVVVLANNRPVAKAEIVIEGDRICVSVLERLKSYDA